MAGDKENENNENAKGLSGKMLPGPFRIHFTAQSSVQLARLGYLTYTWDAEPGLDFTSHTNLHLACSTRSTATVAVFTLSQFLYLFQILTSELGLGTILLF